jgi:uncharacterized protein YjbI with pentapeptide repeats
VEPEKPGKTPRERAEALIRLLVPDWRPTAWQGLWAIRIVLAIIVGLGLLTVAGRPFGITLWDWLELLVVPAVIAGGGLWFTNQRAKTDREIAKKSRQDEALQAYIDHMSDMLIPKEGQPSLYKAQPDPSLRSVARARTLTVLKRLDGYGKARVVQFLYESELLDIDQPVVDLIDADLSSAMCDWSNLSKINLSRTSLSKATLSNISLSEANLSETNLSETNLSKTNLSKTNLSGADLSDADLSDAEITREQLASVKSLEGATMPNGQKYEDWFKDQGRGEDGATPGPS